MDILEQRAEITQISAHFFSYRNDIEVYTEDEPDDKEFYRVLFDRLLEGTGIRLRDVHPLGGCDQVEQAFLSDSHREGKLYVMDGDIYLMFAPKLSEPHKFVLDAYCIENMVCDETAWVEYLYEKWGIKPIEECRTALDFNTRIDAVMAPFLNLYRHYALEKLSLGKYKLSGIEAFFDGKVLGIKIGYLQSKIDAIISNLKAQGVSEAIIRSTLDVLTMACSDSRENFMRCLSGKDWLIKYFESIVCHITGINLKEANRPLKLKLAKHCGLDRLEGLKRAMIQIAGE